jgi:hypothetical protein
MRAVTINLFEEFDVVEDTEGYKGEVVWGNDTQFVVVWDYDGEVVPDIHVQGQNDFHLV